MKYCEICQTSNCQSLKPLCDICLKPINEKHINCQNIRKQIKKIKKIKEKLLDEEWVLYGMENFVYS